MKSLFQYELIFLKSSKTFWVLLGCLLLGTLYGLQNGRSYYQKQVETIESIKENDLKTYQESLKNFTADTITQEGKMQFYQATEASSAMFSSRINVYWQPSVLSILSIGNRDIYPYYQELLPISLYMRLLKNEIANPLTLLTGNIDFLYIIIFLIPLFLIALTFNLVAFDKESNISSIIEISVPNKVGFYGKRYLIYVTIITIILAIMFLIATIIFLPKGVEFSSVFILFVMSALYTYFWLGLSLGINLLGKSSTTNISILLVCWLFFTVLMPSVINQIMINKYPVETEKLTNNIRRIQISDDEREHNKILAVFYAHYPQYKPLNPLKHDELSFDKAYFAQGQLNDKEGDQSFKEMIENMESKSGFLNVSAYMNPSMLLQKMFCNYSKTNLNDYLNYLRYVQQYNGKVKDFYLKRTFQDNRITLEDFKKNYPKFSY
ncbi:MAG: MARVEL domain-containing protein [Arcicella sp.]|jgi:ABC-2 type transport system permease protein|nr:MARVEL domain-containing protein [Arcicella sp.]